jgi:hypothetical protein
MTEEQFALSDALTGQHGDLAIEMTRAALRAAAARAAGDRATAAEESQTALGHVRAVSGIDDDFSIFWVAALDDHLAAGNQAAAEIVLAEIADAPRGHVSTLLRGLLPWMRARVHASRDVDAVADDYRQAAEALRRFGAPFYLARALIDQAEWLDALGRVAEAMPIAAEARELFAQLQAAPWLGRAERLAGGSSAAAGLASSTRSGT